MSFFTEEQYKTLLGNGTDESRDRDLVPIVKLFLPGTGCTWLITDIDPEDTDIAFGLCDLGMGFPELGSVSIAELESLQLGFAKVERDLDFVARFPISVYSRASRMLQYITTDETILGQYGPPVEPGQQYQQRPQP